MLAISIIALISTAGIAFYVRFVVALCRERKSQRRIYGCCVRLDCDEAKVIDPASDTSTTHEGTTNDKELRKDLSMSIQELAPEQLAQLFHHYHQALTADPNCSGDPQSESWEQVPQQERSASYRPLV